jgi:hypothetical protein
MFLSLSLEHTEYNPAGDEIIQAQVGRPRYLVYAAFTGCAGSAAHANVQRIARENGLTLLYVNVNPPGIPLSSADIPAGASPYNIPGSRQSWDSAFEREMDRIGLGPGGQGFVVLDGSRNPVALQQERSRERL